MSTSHTLPPLPELDAIASTVMRIVGLQKGTARHVAEITLEYMAQDRAALASSAAEQSKPAAPVAAVPDGFRIVAVKGFDDLIFWLDRCERKGHLDNCFDLVEPWGKFEWQEVSPDTTSTACAPVASVPDILAKVGALIKTQNNRYTDQPMFIVQQKQIITGIDTGYTDQIAWLDADSMLTSGEEFDTFEANYKEDLTEPDGWTRMGYHEQWEFVTACFTEQGCKDYIAINGHNLKEPRIYADGSYRNHEFQEMRKALIACSSPTPPVQLTAERVRALSAETTPQPDWCVVFARALGVQIITAAQAEGGK
jgi:hypothetical protein